MSARAAAALTPTGNITVCVVVSGSATTAAEPAVISNARAKVATHIHAVAAIAADVRGTIPIRTRLPSSTPTTTTIVASGCAAIVSLVQFIRRVRVGCLARRRSVVPAAAATAATILPVAVI